MKKIVIKNKFGKTYVTAEVKRRGVLEIYINMPHSIRANNLQPFTIEDILEFDVDVLISDLQQQLLQNGMAVDICESRVSAIECNITRKVAGKATCTAVLNLLNRCNTDRATIVYQAPNKDCPSKRDNSGVIASVKNQYIVKAYDKSADERRQGHIDVEDGLLRIEIIMEKRILERLFHADNRLRDVLQMKSLRKVMDEYRRLFVVEVVEKRINPLLNSVTNILFETLVATKHPVETIALQRDAIVDVEVFRKALKRWYRHKLPGCNVSNNTNRVINWAKKYDFPRDVIKTISEFKVACGG